MAITLKFRFQLSKHGSLIEPGASLWVDTDDDDDIAEEDRIDLKADDANPLLWTAEVALKVEKGTGVGFVMQFIGDPDAKWSLTVKSDEAGKDVVYEAKDRLVEKTFRHIMGWCK